MASDGTDASSARSVVISLPASTRFRLCTEQVAWSTLGDDAVLVQLERDEIHVANSTGAVLVDLLRDGATLDELTSLVLDQFDVEPAQARADVEEFVGRLVLANAAAPSGNEPIHPAHL